MATCEFCNHTFINIYNLSRHQKSSLKCIKNQKDRGLDVQRLSFECKFCNRLFTEKSYLNRHFKICKSVEIETLKRQLEGVNINRSSTVNNDHSTTNNTTNNKNSHNTYNNTYNVNINHQEFKNLQIFDVSVIKEQVLQRVTEDVIKSGLNNTANHVADSISPYVVTTDLARQIIIIKDKDLKPNKKDAIYLAAGILRDCSDGLTKMCGKAMEDEMKKQDRHLYEKSNIRARNNICTVQANINDNKKGNVNDLSRKTGQYLSKKSYNRTSGISHEHSLDEECVPDRPIETDMLYDDSEGEEFF